MLYVRVRNKSFLFPDSGLRDARAQQRKRPAIAGLLYSQLLRD
jgi:hypothetical protein